MDYATQRQITAALKECGIPHTWISVALAANPYCLKTGSVEPAMILSEATSSCFSVIDNEGKFFVIDKGSVTTYSSYEQYVSGVLPEGCTFTLNRQRESLAPSVVLDMTFFQARKAWEFTHIHRGLRVSFRDNFVVIDTDGLGAVPVYGRKPQISEGFSPEELTELKQLGVVKVLLQKFGGHKFYSIDEPTLELATAVLESTTFRFWRGKDDLFGDIISPKGDVYYFGRSEGGSAYLRKSSKSIDMDLGEWLDH